MKRRPGSGKLKTRSLTESRSSVLNLQSKCGVGLRRIGRFLKFVLGCAQRLDRKQPWDEVSLVLVDNGEITKINKRHLGSSHVTDVIAFNYNPIPGTEGRLAGEIFVNVERAVEEGPRQGGCSRELALYIAHGCDHLAGGRDHTAAGRSRMRARELRWLGKAKRLGLLEGLVRPCNVNSRIAP